MIRLLLEAGAEVDAASDSGRTPLMEILNQTSHTRTIQAFQIVKMLLMAGADLDVKNKNGTSAREFFRPRRKDPPISKQFHEELLDALEYTFSNKQRSLGKEANPMNEQDWDLFFAACCGSVEDVRDALSKGANVEFRPSEDFTALMFAVFYNDADVVRCLIEEGHADLEASVEGATALCFALLTPTEDASVVRVLIEAGANIHVRGTADCTPLMIASSVPETPDKMIALIEAGADVNEQRNGKDALVKALEEGRFKNAKVLLAAGANQELLSKYELEINLEGK